jgi:hypothetical protein
LKIHPTPIKQLEASQKSRKKMSPNNLEDESKSLLAEDHPQRRSSYGGLNGSVNSSQGKLNFKVFLILGAIHKNFVLI